MIAAGTRLGPYAITAPIGAGGMGEVYRATDGRLKRHVALKILTASFATDADRLARFQREAQVLASLNHPNIAAIYGVEESNGIRALVMELVEGPTLADRIRQGPIPVEEALPIAKQIAEALEAAHEQGIIHRDLKPANIKLRPDGTVKVLDFGLAKALEPNSAHVDATASPTITSPAMMTGVGMLLGTAAYMSPEQARGKAVDRRSDIWAFGCVLYEMLTRRRAFEADDVSLTLARVLEREPEWNWIPTEVPSRVRQAMRACLRKDPKQRIGDAQSLRLALEGAFETAATHTQGGIVAHSVWGRRLTVAAASGIVAVLVTTLAAWSLWPAEAPPTVTRFDYDIPPGQQVTGQAGLAVSPDGRQFAYMTAEGLYLRTMETLEATLIQGTQGTNPFFSPDGESVGYWSGGELKRASVRGGAPVVICASAAPPFGASWGPNNMILFAQRQGIMRVSASGGTPELVIKAGTGEQFDGPQWMPDGDSVLFSVTTGTGRTRWDEAQVVVQSLRTGERTVVLRGGSDARYVSRGHLIYALQNGLFAVAFDADRLQVNGGALSVTDGLVRAMDSRLVSEGGSAAANYGVSEEGTLVYLTGVAPSTRRSLVWVDRQGREEPLAAPPRSYVYARLSPDGTRVALSTTDQQADIWVWELARGTLTRVTFNPDPDLNPAWSHDGKRLLFSSVLGGTLSNVFWQAADGTGSPERLIEHPTTQVPQSVSPDGSRILLREGSVSNYNVTVLSLGAERRTEPLIHTEFQEQNAEISPDGRWLAYQSDESGKDEVYVRPFPNVDGGRWQASTSGGTRPLWARNGQELFYMATAGTEAAVMSVRVEPGATWTAAVPTKLFAGRFFFVDGGGSGIGRTYDVSLDGRRFLMIKDSSSGTSSDETPGRFVVVQNWFEELKRLVPTP